MFSKLNCSWNENFLNDFITAPIKLTHKILFKYFLIPNKVPFAFQNMFFIKYTLDLIKPSSFVYLEVKPISLDKTDLKLF